MSGLNRNNRSLLPFGLILIWLMLVLAFYFVIHKPADPAQIAGVAAWLPGLTITGLITIVASALGYRLLGKFFADNNRSILALGIGLGVFSLSGLILGLLGVLRSEIAWSLIAIAAIFSGRSLKAWWLDLRQLFASLKPTTRFARLTLWYCLFVLAITLLQSLTPPIAWDGLAYHLKGPELYLSAGRITQVVGNPYLGFPQFGEMLFMFAQLLGISNPTVFHWLFAVATTVLIATQAQKLWGQNAGWLAAAIFLSAETIVLEAGWPYVDLMLAFYTLAATVCLQRWRVHNESHDLILTGAFTGLALATKYSAVALVVGLLLAILFQREQSRLRSMAIVIGMAGLVASPWYVKNWLVEGNPFYPMLAGGPYWDAIRSQGFSRPGSGLAFTAPWQILTAPWDMTIWGVEGKIGYTATIGPLYLMLVPIVLLFWRTLDRLLRAALRDILLVCAGLYAVWLVGLALSETFLQARLLIPLFPLLASVSAGAFQILQRYDRPQVSLRRLAVILASLVILATGVKISLDFMGSGTLTVLAGAQSAEAYLTDRLGWYYVTMQSMLDLGPAARVRFLWEPRSLYCRADCQPDALLDNWWHARRTLGSAEQIAAAWRAAGDQYILLNRSGYEAVIQLNLLKPTAEDQQALQALITNHLQLVRSFGTQYELYRWQ